MAAAVRRRWAAVAAAAFSVAALLAGVSLASSPVTVLQPADGAAMARASGTARTEAAPRCLADGTGYLRAQIRGAIDTDVDWRRADLECEGGMRPDGHGIRVSFAGTARFGGAAHRLRFIFGIAAAGEGRSGHAVPANVTLILEGERRIFSTRGDDKCTIDELRQEPLARTRRRRDYRVGARGFCVEPASRVGAPPATGGRGAGNGLGAGSEHVLVSRFDFVGRVTLYTDAAASGSAHAGAGAAGTPL